MAFFIHRNPLQSANINYAEDLKDWIDLNLIIEKIKTDFYLNQEDKILISNEKLPTIYTDKNQISSLFQNLIENGLKYNDNAQKHIHIGTKTLNDRLLITVEDNGIGIEEQFHDQIFKMFKRLHTSENYEGSGLGLAICKKIVENMNGKISLSSIMGKGTTFYIDLPKK